MNDNRLEETAVLYSEVSPNAEQLERFKTFLKQKYGKAIAIEWQESLEFPGGFRLQVGDQVYDWSVNARFEQLQERLQNVSAKGKDLIPLLKDTIDEWVPGAVAHELGVVKTVGDGIAVIEGLEHATYGEILLFPSGTRGMVQDLRENEIGCILFADDDDISQGSPVYRTGKTAGIPVGDGFLGRVVNPLGAPIDGNGEIESEGYRPIENPAPGIIDRQAVNTPMETGLIAIDSMFPIGRGQRELIIGDRQTGKTAIALDTILNQRDKDVVCIYVAIGQKASSVAQLVGTLRKADALKYTVVLCATASDSAPLQYVAPYAGTALGEYFMSKGKDVLIVYDDLSKHAIAYRSMSLLLGRSPGREAYPGDVFYLHSRLLERSAHLNDALGGGSLTALPIVETQAGDVSAYIPTNIISITDGQIFLESDLFYAGQRPAVNVGLSVSRVGGDAQTKAVKKAASTLRLDLAQYREMEVFTQFSSDLDDNTKRQLKYGQGLMQMLKQKQNHPYQQQEQVVVLVTMLGHLMQELPNEEVPSCIAALLKEYHEKHAELLNEIQSTKHLTDEMKAQILEISKTLIENYQKQRS